ncbi:MAG: DNA repair protein RecN [Alphaproteobacteria bacterium]|nr:DNA repair protein RecN [Alphaproteobacteria bacterium]
MLRQLSVREVVLIDRLDLAIEAGLAVLTGETGAGKSILLDALGLALGARGDAGLVRAGAAQATVAAAFEPAGDHPVFALLAGQGIDAGDGMVVLRRTLGRDGRSRAFVNDQPASVGLLRQAGALLVEVHGQHEAQGLLDAKSHRGVLDAFAGTDAALAATGRAWTARRDAAAAHTEAAAASERARADEAHLREACAELDALAPVAGEEATLAERRTMMQNAERLGEALAAAAENIDGDTGADASLAMAVRAIGRVAANAGGRLDEALGALGRAAAELAEAARALQSAAGDIDSDPRALERIEERLFALRAVARKHATPVDGLPATHARLAAALAAIDDGGSHLSLLARAAEAARSAWFAAAETLSAARSAAARRLDCEIAAELPPLRLDRAVFVTKVERLPEAQWGAEGFDRVNFLVATNPGVEPGPLERVASGGELARLMLALEVVLAGKGSAATLVFDEVDAGVGGATAAAVGERLAHLAAGAAGRQVLVVTHSPQVAALGSHHWRVSKEEQDGTALTRVLPLDPAAREEEIARMLSGAVITAEARAAARRLMPDAPQAAGRRRS